MGLFVDLGCTVLYVQYVIHVSDAGIRTWYAATVTRCTTNELRTSLCQCGSWFLCVCRWRRNAGMSWWWLVRIIKILLKLLTSSIWDIVQCPLRKSDKNVCFLFQEGYVFFTIKLIWLKYSLKKFRKIIKKQNISCKP